MNCNNCGQYNMPGTSNCVRCGANLQLQNSNNVQNMNNMQTMNNTQYVNNYQSQMNNKKNNKNYIVIGVVCLLVVILGIVFIPKLFSKKNSSIAFANSYFDTNNYIAVKQDGKYGFINQNGKMVIKPKYDYVQSDFTDGYAVVSVKNSEGSNSYYVINKKGEEKLSVSSYNGIKYNKKHGIWYIGGKIYDKNMKLVSGDRDIIEYEDGYAIYRTSDRTRSGLLNTKGKSVFETSSEGVDDLYISKYSVDDDVNEEYCAIYNNLKAYIVNCDTGKVVYEDTNVSMHASAKNNIFSIYSLSTSKYKYVYIRKNKIFYESENMMYYKNGYLSIKENDKTYYLDVSKNIKYDKEPEEYSNSSTDYSLFKTKGYNIINCSNNGTRAYGVMKDDKSIVACEWSEIKQINATLNMYLSSNGKYYVLGKKDGKSYLINLKNGKIISQFDTKYLSTSESIFIEYIDETTDEKVIYNVLTGKSIRFEKSAQHKLYSTYFTITNAEKVDYYNSKLKLIYTEVSTH